MDRMRILRLLFLFVGLFCALPLVADIPTGDELRAQAEQGNADAKNELGVMQSQGRDGVTVGEHSAYPKAEAADFMTCALKGALSRKEAYCFLCKQYATDEETRLVFQAVKAFYPDIFIESEGPGDGGRFRAELFFDKKIPAEGRCELAYVCAQFIKDGELRPERVLVDIATGKDPYLLCEGEPLFGYIFWKERESLGAVLDAFAEAGSDICSFLDVPDKRGTPCMLAAIDYAASGDIGRIDDFRRLAEVCSRQGERDDKGKLRVRDYEKVLERDETLPRWLRKQMEKIWSGRGNLLEYAVARGAYGCFDPIVKILGVSPNIPLDTGAADKSKGETVLHRAVWMQDWNAVKDLIDLGALDCPRHNGTTPSDLIDYLERGGRIDDGRLHEAQELRRRLRAVSPPGR